MKYYQMKDILIIRIGEIKDIGPYIDFYKQKYERDVELGGYYALITSKINLADEKTIEKYRGL